MVCFQWRLLVPRRALQILRVIAMILGNGKGNFSLKFPRLNTRYIWLIFVMIALIYVLPLQDDTYNWLWVHGCICIFIGFGRISFASIAAPRNFSLQNYFHLNFHLIYCLILQGPSSKNPLSYKWYNAEEEILGKKMKVGNSLILFEFSMVVDWLFCQQ